MLNVLHLKSVFAVCALNCTQKLCFGKACIQNIFQTLKLLITSHNFYKLLKIYGSNYPEISNSKLFGRKVL